MRIRIAIAAVLIASCTQEDIVVKDYPRMDVAGVETNSTSATFHANLLSPGSEPITEHGFEWGAQPPSGEPSKLDRIVLGALSGTEFSTTVNRGIDHGVVYVVRGFVQTGKYRVVGGWTTFMGTGSLSPVVTDIVPSTATWGDTLTIHGQRFSFNREIVKVWFSTSTGDPAGVLSSTDQVIKVIVPQSLQDKTETQLKITVGDESVISNAVFKLSPQEITSISPEAVSSQSVVTILGKNFLPYGNKVDVSTGNEFTPFLPATILINTANEIQFKIPPVAPGGVLLRITSGALVKEIPDAFTRLSPVVTSITPNLVFDGDVIRITGSNFGEGYTDNKVEFGGKAEIGGTVGLIVGMAPGQIDVQVPSFRDLALILTADFVSTTIPNAVALKDPVITSATAGPVFPGQIFEVVGDYLSGYFFVGDIPVMPTAGSKTGLTAVMPLVTEYSPVVRIERSGQTSNTNVTLTSPTRAMKVPGHAIAHCASFSIGSNGYIVASPKSWDAPPSNVWKYDQTSDQWVQLDDFPGEGRSGATAFSLDGNGYLLGGTPTSPVFATDLWKFVAATASWVRLGDLPFHAIESFIVDGEAYVISDVTLGMDDTGVQIVIDGQRKVWKYDPSLDGWNVRANVPVELHAEPTYRDYFTMAIGNRFFLATYAGGTSQVLEYVAGTDSWSFKQQVEFDNGVPYAIQYNGMALVFDASNRLYKYEPNSDTWTMEQDQLSSNMWLAGQPTVFNIGDKTYFGLFHYNRFFENANPELKNLFFEFDGNRAGF